MIEKYLPDEKFYELHNFVRHSDAPLFVQLYEYRSCSVVGSDYSRALFRGLEEDLANSCRVEKDNYTTYVVWKKHGTGYVFHMAVNFSNDIAWITRDRTKVNPGRY